MDNTFILVGLNNCDIDGYHSVFYLKSIMSGQFNEIYSSSKIVNGQFDRLSYVRTTGGYKRYNCLSMNLLEFNEGKTWFRGDSDSIASTILSFKVNTLISIDTLPLIEYYPTVQTICYIIDLYKILCFDDIIDFKENILTKHAKH